MQVEERGPDLAALPGGLQGNKYLGCCQSNAHTHGWKTPSSLPGQDLGVPRKKENRAVRPPVPFFVLTCINTLEHIPLTILTKVKRIYFLFQVMTESFILKLQF